MCDAAKAQQNHTDELRRLHGRVKELDVHCERLRLVAEGSHDGLWDWPDVNVDRQWWSPRFLELLGYAGDAFEPTLEQFFDLLHPDDRERCRVEVSARLTEDEPFETEYRLRTASGAYRWFCARGRTFRDAAGNPVRMAGSVRDITDSKVLEMALRASEEKYRGIFDESVAAIYVFDARKRFVDSNQAGLDLLGYSREELLSMSIPDVDADPTVVLPAHARLLSGGTLVRYEHQLKRKDGRIITVLNNSRPLSDAQGNVVGMQSTLIDITKRKKAEEALRKSEETFRGFVENATELVYSLSLDGTFIYVAPSVTELLGYDLHELLGKHYSFMVHPDDLPMCDAFFRELVSTGRQRAGAEYRVRRKDGDWRWHTSNASALKDAGGNVVSYVGISRDITERKRTEEELRRERDFAASLLDTVQVIVLMLDCEGRIVYINRYMEDLSGYQSEEVRGKDWFSTFLPPGDSDRVRALFRQATADIQTRGNVNPIVTKDGRRREIEWHDKTLKDAAGNTTGLLAVGLDVTDRKRAERELVRHRDHLEELVRKRTAALEAAQAELLVKERLATLGRLTATVSHELRNPLGTVRTSFFSIAEEVRDLGLDLDDVLERAERNIVRCDSIIEELLDYTRSKRPETVPTRIDEWLAGVLDEQDIGADVSVTRALASDAEIAIDRERLRRAVVNLVTNACQAMQNIEDTERQLAVETAVRNGRLEISVTDTGHGIPPEQMQKVFEPLYSTKGFGVGLGLPTVMQIMKMHGGGIEMESEPGVGTRAVLWLPLASTEGVRDERTAHSGSGRQR